MIDTIADDIAGPWRDKLSITTRREKYQTYAIPRIRHEWRAGEYSNGPGCYHGIPQGVDRDGYKGKHRRSWSFSAALLAANAYTHTSLMF